MGVICVIDIEAASFVVGQCFTAKFLLSTINREKTSR
jgi:hypothetical protein